MQLTIGFITTCSGRWPREVPEQRNREYGEWLEAQMPEVKVVRAPELGSGIESVAAAVSDFMKYLLKGKTDCIPMHSAQ